MASPVPRPPSQVPSRAASRPPSQAPPYIAPPPQQNISPYLAPPGGAPPMYGQQSALSGPILPGPYAHPPPPPQVSFSPVQSQSPYQQQGQGPYQQSPYQQTSGRRKRLIATCDGTWLDSDSGANSGGKAQPPSNVSRIGWAMKDTSSDGIPQIIHYSAGVGSQGGKVTKVVSGITGMGLADNVRESYSFISVNYSQGDEIFLIGFSRGAWTARSVGGVIEGVGLLTRTGMPFFPAIYEDWENRADQNYVSKQPDVPFPNKPPFNDPSYVAELQRLGYTRRNIPIKAIAVWDTVGSLGIPRFGILEVIGLQPRVVHEYSFYDTNLGLNVENAFQALALDEHRSPFSPALWEKPKGSHANLKQVWFPGVHSNIGGGYTDADLANITLAWMISRLEPFIDFRPDYIMEQSGINRHMYKSNHERPRPWSFGLIHNSLKDWYRFSGSKTRTPGAYFRTDPITGRVTTEHLRQTNEFIHASVRCRTALRGPGVADRGIYQPRALSGWDTVAIPQPPGGPEGEREPLIVWRKKRITEEEEGGQNEIPEAALLDTELRLLNFAGPKVEPFVRSMQTKASRKKSHRDGGGRREAEKDKVQDRESQARNSARNKEGREKEKRRSRR